MSMLKTTTYDQTLQSAGTKVSGGLNRAAMMAVNSFGNESIMPMRELIADPGPSMVKPSYQ